MVLSQEYIKYEIVSIQSKSFWTYTEVKMNFHLEMFHILYVVIRKNSWRFAFCSGSRYADGRRQHGFVLKRGRWGSISFVKSE